MADWSLVDGWLPVALLVAAGLGVVGLLLTRRFTTSWWVWIAVALVVAAAAFLGLNFLVVDVLRMFPEPMPTSVVAWLGIGLGAVILVVGAMLGTSVPRKLIALLGGVLVVVTVAAQVNDYFQEYRTVGDLFAEAPTGDLPRGAGASQSESTPVVDRWRGTATATAGQVTTENIPGTVSGFVARAAYIYTPPAYAAPGAPLLPVLVLVAGQPGGPEDWVTGGQLVSTLDAFAQAHHGLAPVTVVVDPNGSALGNTMCMDSSIGKVDTYLSRDVPAWIASNLSVDTNPEHWTFGGFSFGGTCAVQMGTMHPDTWKSILAISAEREPALGPDRNQTIDTAFGGDAAAFDAVTPLNLMATRTYPQTWAYFAVGGADTGFAAYLTELSQSATKAQMQVQTSTVAGQGHSWTVAATELPLGLAWLSPKLGFTKS